jgi:hypothetical protein
MDRKTLQIDIETHANLQEQAAKKGFPTVASYIRSLTNFIDKTGVNPLEDFTIYEELKDMKKRLSNVIGFFRKFETEQMIPLVEVVKMSLTRLGDVLPEHEEGVKIASNKELVQAVKIVKEQIATLAELQLEGNKKIDRLIEGNKLSLQGHNLSHFYLKMLTTYMIEGEKKEAKKMLDDYKIRQAKK